MDPPRRGVSSDVPIVRVIVRLVLGAAVVAGLLGVGANLWIARAAGPAFDQALDVPERPVAIVPGAAVHGDGTPSPVLEDRLACALELHRTGRVGRILVSGDAGAGETAAMRRWLVERGVAEASISEDPAGRRTYATMARAAHVFGVQGAVVCTQAFHMARSIFWARREGIDAVGCLADRRRYPASNDARELVARTAAFVEAYVTGPVR
jgi:SanA protein